MKQVAQNYKSGDLAVLDVPVPACQPGGVLVRSLYSLISTGTEMMKVSEARMSLVSKARARPDQVRKLLDSVAQQGALATYQKAMNRLDSYTPLGYSLCGVVVEVGAGAEQFSVGQLVAAAGNEFALHAEMNWVPVNLCVPVPDGVAAEHAAFATVGAIAMQGVRRAEVALGETACVIGLGLIGQLVVRLLIASGVHVVGLDVVEARCRAAEKAGALVCAAPDEDGIREVERVLLDRTGGLGADHVLLSAGGDSNGPVEVAARLARDRARVVDIGKTRLDLPWNAYYNKELDVRFSRSYGPGRYDDRYELEGVDYPAGYVRWTERRNLACFLDLLVDGSVDVASLISGIHPVEEAADVYDRLGSGSLQGVGFLLSYGDPAETVSLGRTLSAPPVIKVCFPSPTIVCCCAPWLHWSRELRHVHAAATPTGQLGGRARDSCHDESPVRAQRPTQVRLRDHHNECRVGARRRHPGRGIHRHAASLACGPGMPSLGARPHRIRREAACPHRGAAHRRPGNRGKDRQRAGHGRVQPQVRAAFCRSAKTLRSVPRPSIGPLLDQCRPAGSGQLVSQ